MHDRYRAFAENGISTLSRKLHGVLSCVSSRSHQPSYLGDLGMVPGGFPGDTYFPLSHMAPRNPRIGLSLCIRTKPMWAHVAGQSSILTARHIVSFLFYLEVHTTEKPRRSLRIPVDYGFHHQHIVSLGPQFW